MDFSISIPIVALAFACELVDSGLGMGYGTILTPVLLLLGYEPVEIVPAVLLSEFITGLTAGIAHHEFGNLNLNRGSRDFKVTFLLAGLSLIGVVGAVAIAISVPVWVIKVYIGILVLAIGVSILLLRSRQLSFCWRRVSGLGVLAAFNKGISGGGYGPVVTGGLVLSGVGSRNAVGMTSLAESVTSALGVLGYYLATRAQIPWHLAPSLLMGALLSVPLAAYAVSRLPHKRLKLAIGGTTTILGCWTLVKVLL
ncbi:MAG: sulfite exporter TauE/SafE family protein [Fidelibacterota bacterium]|nr:MAG: sulfite exporter TauE/SafE family protein [Candidatus Neomarinimicrobiota bacterium]